MVRKSMTMTLKKTLPPAAAMLCGLSSIPVANGTAPPNGCDKGTYFTRLNADLTPNCKACPDGHYQDENNSRKPCKKQCQPEAGASGLGGRFITTEGDKTKKQVCQKMTDCTEEEYESAAGTHTTDRVCSAVTTCTTTQYETQAPTWNEDRQCKECDTCPVGKHETTACTPKSNRLCTANTPCVGDGNKVAKTAPTSTKDRVCQALTVCKPGEYESKAPVYNPALSSGDTLTDNNFLTEDRECKQVTPEQMGLNFKLSADEDKAANAWAGTVSRISTKRGTVWGNGASTPAEEEWEISYKSYGTIAGYIIEGVSKWASTCAPGFLKVYGKVPTPSETSWSCPGDCTTIKAIDAKTKDETEMACSFEAREARIGTTEATNSNLGLQKTEKKPTFPDESSEEVYAAYMWDPNQPAGKKCTVFTKKQLEGMYHWLESENIYHAADQNKYKEQYFIGAGASSTDPDFYTTAPAICAKYQFVDDNEHSSGISYKTRYTMLPAEGNTEMANNIKFAVARVDPDSTSSAEFDQFTVRTVWRSNYAFGGQDPKGMLYKNPRFSSFNTLMVGASQLLTGTTATGPVTDEVLAPSVYCGGSGKRIGKVMECKLPSRFSSEWYQYELYGTNEDSSVQTMIGSDDYEDATNPWNPVTNVQDPAAYALTAGNSTWCSSATGVCARTGAGKNEGKYLTYYNYYGSWNSGQCSTYDKDFAGGNSDVYSQFCSKPSLQATWEFRLQEEGKTFHQNPNEALLAQLSPFYAGMFQQTTDGNGDSIFIPAGSDSTVQSKEFYKYQATFKSKRPTAPTIDCVCYCADADCRDKASTGIIQVGETETTNEMGTADDQFFDAMEVDDNVSEQATHDNILSQNTVELTIYSDPTFTTDLAQAQQDFSEDAEERLTTVEDIIYLQVEAQDAAEFIKAGSLREDGKLTFSKCYGASHPSHLMGTNFMDECDAKETNDPDNTDCRKLWSGPTPDQCEWTHKNQFATGINHRAAMEAESELTSNPAGDPIKLSDVKDRISLKVLPPLRDGDQVLNQDTFFKLSDPLAVWASGAIRCEVEIARGGHRYCPNPANRRALYNTAGRALSVAQSDVMYADSGVLPLRIMMADAKREVMTRGKFGFNDLNYQEAEQLRNLGAQSAIKSAIEAFAADGLPSSVRDRLDAKITGVVVDVDNQNQRRLSAGGAKVEILFELGLVDNGQLSESEKRSVERRSSSLTASGGAMPAGFMAAFATELAAIGFDSALLKKLETSMYAQSIEAGIDASSSTAGGPSVFLAPGASSAQLLNGGSYNAYNNRHNNGASGQDGAGSSAGNVLLLAACGAAFLVSVMIFGLAVSRSRTLKSAADKKVKDKYSSSKGEVDDGDNSVETESTTAESDDLNANNTQRMKQELRKEFKKKQRIGGSAAQQNVLTEPQAEPAL